MDPGTDPASGATMWDASPTRRAIRGSEVPELLLQEVSPYGTRRGSLVRGDDDTYLYLEDLTTTPASTVSAVWVGNGTPAPLQPAATQEAGAPARMLAAGTRHPAGCPPLMSPRLVWFEEGDGVLLVDDDGVVAVVPGWAGRDGLYGYSRWAVGASPLANELDPELARRFGDVAVRSEAYWSWRLGDRARTWDEIRSEGMEHLTGCLGPVEEIREPADGAFPEVSVSRHRAGGADVWITATTGLSAARMARAGTRPEDQVGPTRVELVLATESADPSALDLLEGLAAIPFSRCTWLGEGHTIGGSPGAFPALGMDCVAVMLTATPPGWPPDLSGLDRRGDPVQYLWTVGIDAATFRLARARGSAAALRRLRDDGRSWIQRSGRSPAGG